MQRLSGEIKHASLANLLNQGFVAKAPADVIEKERANKLNFSASADTAY